MNNIKPRTRDEREAEKNKESIEKTRINQRFGLEARNIDAKDLLHNSDPKSTLYLPENERFDKDFSVYDKKMRELNQEKKDRFAENHRIEVLDREALRWEKLKHEEVKNEAKLNFHKEVLLNGKKNTSGMAYNPLTLEYENSSKGESLKVKDEQSQVRAALRSTNIDTRSNSGYNILTGEVRPQVNIPDNLRTKYPDVIDNALRSNTIKGFRK